MAKIPGARAWLLVTALCAISGIAYEAGKPAENQNERYPLTAGEAAARSGAVQAEDRAKALAEAQGEKTTTGAVCCLRAATATGKMNTSAANGETCARPEGKTSTSPEIRPVTA